MSNIMNSLLLFLSLAKMTNLPPLPMGEGWGEGNRHSGGSRNPASFTPEQVKWLKMIRDHIAANLSIEPDDFEYAPFAQEGGFGRVHQLFDDRLNAFIDELSEMLAA